VDVAVPEAPPRPRLGPRHRALPTRAARGSGLDPDRARQIRIQAAVADDQHDLAQILAVQTELPLRQPGPVLDLRACILADGQDRLDAEAGLALQLREIELEQLDRLVGNALVVLHHGRYLIDGGKRLADQLIDRQPRRLLPDQRHVGLLGHDVDVIRRDDGRKPPQRRLEQALVAKQGQERFGSGAARQRPQSRTAATGKDHGVHSLAIVTGSQPLLPVRRDLSRRTRNGAGIATARPKLGQPVVAAQQSGGRRARGGSTNRYFLSFVA
jgi:hypothetical protein